MVYSIAEHIISPLGVGIEANLTALHEGRTALQRHDTLHGTTLVEPIYASLLPDNPQPTPRFPDSPIPRFTNPLDGYTLFESWCICCVQGALNSLSPDSPIHRFTDSPRTIFILSSTKGDIWTPNTETARHIAQFFGNTQSPIVVSLACTSGVSAQITAWRLLECGMYDTAVVIGCDVLTDFVAAGFQCVHATSMQPCRPFDKDREGLNLGEAVGCLILRHSINSHECGASIHHSINSSLAASAAHQWSLLGGSIHNDANHISGPSRTAEGAYRCLQDMLSVIDKEDLACVSVHGTATLYNDEMESIALHRAGLDDIPVSALKGYYGHTMGAAGVVETILTMHALDKGIIPAVRGFEQQGTTYAANVSNQERTTGKTSFIKLLSGFGGVNAAVAWTKSPIVASEQQFAFGETTIVASEQQFADSPIHRFTGSPIHRFNLSSAYKALAIDYPKFYKMDTLSKVAFVAVEQLLQQVRQNQPDFTLDSERCVLIFANRYSSICDNRDFQKTIENKDDYFPSPALFVYTLPNVMMGEIAIRHHLFGETACYILDKEEDLQPIVQSTFPDSPIHRFSDSPTQALVAWVECTDDEHFEAHVQLFNLS